ncbi:hypothetical protein [Coleofasciculus sp. E2-BRE-01]|uniref:hypothetical protein n=1 Tax=Coleofasciculus sp. E2-BRE-01 TaxID=3069524 RepID=UPI0032FF67D7
MNSTQDYMHDFAIKKQEIMELVDALINKQKISDKSSKSRQKILDEISNILVFIQRIERLSIKKKQVDRGHEPRVLELTSIVEVLIPAVKSVVDDKAGISLVKQTRIRLLRSLRRHEPFFLILRRSFLNYGTPTSDLSQVSQSLETISNEREAIKQTLAGIEEPPRTLNSLGADSRPTPMAEQVREIESTLTSLEEQVKDQLQVMDEQNQPDKQLTISLPFGLETISLSPEDSQIIFRVFVVGASGALGSVVSILIRLKEFDVEFREILDPVIPFLIGAVKPIIGASFGVFMYTLISSGLIPLDTNPTDTKGRKEELFYFAIAFTVGFSERLAKDVIARAETTVQLGNVKEIREIREIDESGEQ